MHVNIPQETRYQAIKDGQEARINDFKKESPYGMALGEQITLRHYWLAGWNDMDIQLGGER